METKRYFFYAIIYIALIWILTFSVTNATFEFELLGYGLNLAVATWVVLPIALFAVLSLLHIGYYGVKNFFDARAVKSDLNLYNSLAKETYLGLEANKDFKTELFKIPSEVTKSLSKWLNAEPNFMNEELKNAYETAKKVSNGEVCELKRYRLLKNNPLFIKNEKNKIDADYKHALSILGEKGEIDVSLKKYAQYAVLSKASWSEIAKFSFEFTLEQAQNLVGRYISGSLDIDGAGLFSILNKSEFTAQDFIDFALKLKNKLDPDQLMSIFEKLKNERSNALEAYLCVLYDLQMLDKLREILNAENDEFEKIRILLFLRDSGKRASLDLFYK